MSTVAQLRAMGLSDQEIQEIMVAQASGRGTQFHDTFYDDYGKPTPPKLPQGITGYDENGNPIVDPSQFSPAPTTDVVPPPSQEAIGMGLTNNVNMPPPAGPQQMASVSPPYQGEVPPQGAAVGGPDIAPQGQMDFGSYPVDPVSSALAGIAGGPHVPYGGGLQQIAAGMGMGLMNYQKQMADMRSSMTRGKFGNTPIYGTRNGQPVVMRFAPDGSMIEAQLPPGVQASEPVQYLDYGSGFMPRGAKTGRNMGPNVRRDLKPAETPQYEQDIMRSKHIVELEKSEPLMHSSIMRQTDKSTHVANTIDQALRLIDKGFATGPMGMISDMPATDANELRGLLATITANEMFSALEDMRANSPTGGALGSITERELDLLGAVNADVRQTQDAKVLKKRLNELKRRHKSMNRRLERAYDRQYKPLGMTFKSNAPLPDKAYPAWLPEEDRAAYDEYNKENK